MMESRTAGFETVPILVMIPPIDLAGLKVESEKYWYRLLERFRPSTPIFRLTRWGILFVMADFKINIRAAEEWTWNI
jgi:hypothetical protein